MAENLPEDGSMLKKEREKYGEIYEDKYKRDLIKKLNRFATWAMPFGVVSLLFSVLAVISSLIILSSKEAVIALILYGAMILLSLLWIKASKEARKYEDEPDSLLSFVDTMRLIPQITIYLIIALFVTAFLAAIIYE